MRWQVDAGLGGRSGKIWQYHISDGLWVHYLCLFVVFYLFLVFCFYLIVLFYFRILSNILEIYLYIVILPWKRNALTLEICQLFLKSTQRRSSNHKLPEKIRPAPAHHLQFFITHMIKLRVVLCFPIQRRMPVDLPDKSFVLPSTWVWGLRLHHHYLFGNLKFLRFIVRKGRKLEVKFFATFLQQSCFEI